MGVADARLWGKGLSILAKWLFKSEPEAFSWDDLVAKGEAGEEWDGVRNYQARNNMRAMGVGDREFLYHSVDEKRIVGIVEVYAEAHPDSTTDDARWECVDVKAVCAMRTPVTLAEVKAHPDLQAMALVKQARLSVVPMSDTEWKILCGMMVSTSSLFPSIGIRNRVPRGRAHQHGGAPMPRSHPFQR